MKQLILCAVFLLAVAIPAQAQDTKPTVNIDCGQAGSLYDVSASCKSVCLYDELDMTAELSSALEASPAMIASSADANVTTNLCSGSAPYCCVSVDQVNLARNGSSALSLPDGTRFLQMILGLAKGEEVSDKTGSANSSEDAKKGDDKTPVGAPIALPDPLSGANLPSLLGNAIRTFAGIAGSIALLMFVYGGVMYILSGGESSKVKDATAILKNAAIGIILIFGAYLFVSAILDAVLA